MVAGSLHYRFPAVDERIIPAYLPFHRELVYLRGAAEVLGGLGMLSERTRYASGLLLVLLLPLLVSLILWARRAFSPHLSASHLSAFPVCVFGAGAEVALQSVLGSS